MEQLAALAVVERSLVVHFTVHGQAKPAGSKKAFKNPKTGKLIVTDDSKGSKPWKQQVAGMARDHLPDDWELLRDVPLAVEFTFYVARPQGHYGVRGLLPSAPSHPTKRPDVLKLARGIEDALTGILWADDAAIVDEQLYKRFGEPERTEISVWALGRA
jgi:Holliday junction resolvase RusA-like endonuclease